MRIPLMLLAVFFLNAVQGATKIKPGPNNANTSSEGPDSTTFNGERTYTFGLDYGTNTSFKGVKADSIKQQHYLMPNFTYAAKSGFYLYGAGYYLPNKITQQWDAMDLSAGFDFKVSEKAQGSISYLRSFFSETSPQVNSSLNNDLQLYFKRKIFSIKSKIAFDFYFGTDTDYSLTWTNSRNFTWEEVFSKDDDFTLSPKIKIIAGSQNFYYTKNPSKHPDHLKNGGKKGGSGGQAKQATVYEFGVLSYILSLPLTYTINNFSIQAAANYSIAGGLNPSRPDFGYYTISLYFVL